MDRFVGDALAARGWRVAGVVTLERDGEQLRHEFIRADVFTVSGILSFMADDELWTLERIEAEQPELAALARLHRVLAEGNFVLSVSEGSLGGVHTSFYDLFRVAGGKIVEHWDTIEAVPPRSEWKNDNGKF